jgi:hypothetical protein
MLSEFLRRHSQFLVAKVVHVDLRLDLASNGRIRSFRAYIETKRLTWLVGTGLLGLRLLGAVRDTNLRRMVSTSYFFVLSCFVGVIIWILVVVRGGFILRILRLLWWVSSRVVWFRLLCHVFVILWSTVFVNRVSRLFLRCVFFIGYIFVFISLRPVITLLLVIA